MTPETVDAVGCDKLERAYNDGTVKLYPKTTSPGPAVSFFAEIQSNLRTDPCSYFRYKVTTCQLIAKNVIDPDDGIAWDFYVMNCPTGPPCHFLEELLSE
jgi:hypothetical protein